MGFIGLVFGLGEDLFYDSVVNVSSFHFSSNPHGEIIRSEAIKDIAAPKFAFFSSRGPNSISDEILKVAHQLLSFQGCMYRLNEFRF